MEKLYHYTSIEALYNMLEKSILTDEETNIKYLNLWATHIEYLNDETERKLFINMLIEETIIYSKKQGITLSYDQIKKIETLCNIDAYIISLSELQDDLNMWRGYGGNGVGVNLEFDFHKLLPFNKILKSSKLKLEQVYNPIICKYFQPKECNIETSLIERVYNYCINNTEIIDYKQTIKEASLITDINRLATISKHAAYISEKEWRFVCKSCPSIPKYIHSNGIIKPYIEFPIPLSSITAITIGPCIKEEYGINGIEQFVKRKLGADVKFRYSEIPYRH